MSSESFGDISLADYRRLAGGRRRVPRFAIVALGIVACGLFMASGVYSGLWSGKNTRELSFEDGMRLLEHPDALDYQQEGGMMAVWRGIKRALVKLEDLGKREDALGRSARGYLLNTSILAVGKLEATTKDPEEQARIDRNLPRRSKEPK